MEENFFKVGYTKYLQETKKEEKKRTSFISKILKNKIIICISVIILMCSAMNFWLIYKFINILYINF